MDAIVVVALALCAANPEAQDVYPVQGEALRFEYRVGPLANLTYHLNCLAGSIACSRDAFQDAWQTQLGWSREDELHLETWRTVTERARAFTDFAEMAADAPPYPLSHAPSFDQLEKFQLAGYAATSLEEYQRNLHMLLVPSDVHRAMRVVHHFWPRYVPWWNQTARSGSRKMAQGFAALMQTADLVAFCEKVARFYGDPLPPGTTVMFHVIWRPRTAQERIRGSVNTNATVVENHSAVEVLDDEQPADRMDVVLHELFHYFYWSMPISDHIHQFQRFQSADDVNALGLYAILDEAVVTALGNGLVAERLRGRAALAQAMEKELGLYKEPFIDAVGKALVRPMEETLARGGRLDDGFVDTYLKVARAALGTRINHPQLLLKMRGIVYFDPSQKAAMQRLKKSFRAISSSAHNAGAPWVLERQPLLSGVVLLTRDQLGELEAHPTVIPPGDLAEIKRLAKKQPALCYGVNRAPKSDVYVLVASDVEALNGLVDAFVKQPVRFVGAGCSTPGP